MKINGILIGEFKGHTNDSSALVNRTLEIYVTKTRVKFYLFKCDVIGWHKKFNVIEHLYSTFTNDTELENNIRYTIETLAKKYKIIFNSHFQYKDVIYHYVGGNEVSYADYGHSIKYKTHTIFKGDNTANGVCYKNINAWDTNSGVIYIGEYGLIDYEVGYDKYADLWTKISWVDWVRNYIKDNYQDIEDINEILSCDKFIESLAYDCLINADWQDLSTILQDFDYNCDWILDNWEEYKNKNI